MAGAGFKNFTTGEVLTASDVQGYLMDQSVMVFAGTAARASAIPSPSEGMVTYRSDDDAVEVYDGSAWSSIGGVGAAVISSPAATGSYTDGGGTTWNYYTFTASGTVTVDTAGFADVLVVGGGGAGGPCQFSGWRSAGGGGAGGYLEIANAYLPSGSLTITVGGGGTGTADPQTISNGNASRIAGLYYGVFGGKGASIAASGAGYISSNGGSGGGGYQNTTMSNGVPGQGNAGGEGNVTVAGGGGGGASAVGGNFSGTTGGAGGAGTASSITGTSVTYAGGGGGSGTTGGAGGAGGGGAGGSGNGTSGTINTGGGGGASGNGGTSGSGGSGIVIVRVAV